MKEKISLQEVNKYSNIYLVDEEVCRNYYNHLELHVFSQVRPSKDSRKESKLQGKGSSKKVIATIGSVNYIEI